MENHYKQLIDTFIAKNPDKDQFVLKAQYGMNTDEWYDLYNKQVVMHNPEYRGIGFYFIDRKSTRLNSSHPLSSRMPSSA